MAEVLGEAVLELTTDSSGLDRGIAEAESSAKSLESTFTELGATLTSLGSSLTLALTAPIVALGGLAVAAADEQIQAIVKLEAALALAGDTSGATLADFEAFAAEIMSVTTVADEVVHGMLQVATSMGLSADASKLAVKEAVGLSAAFGISERTAIRMTAALSEGNTTMLTRYIPTLRAVEDDSERVAKAHELLGGSFDLAKVAAEAGLGPLEQLKNELGELQEQVGTIVIDAMTPFIDRLKDMAIELQGMDPELLKQIVRWAAVAAAIGPVLIVVGQLVSAIGTLLPALSGIATVLAGPVGLAAALVAVALAIEPVRALLFDLGSRVLANLKAAVALVVTAIVDWWQQTTAFREVLGQLVAIVADFVGGALVAYLDLVGRVIVQLAEWWAATDRVRAFVAALATVIASDWVGAVSTVVGWIGNLIQLQVTLWRGLGDTIARFVEWVGSFTAVQVAADTVSGVLSTLTGWLKQVAEVTLKAINALGPFAGLLGVIVDKVGEWAEEAEELVEQQEKLAKANEESEEAADALDASMDGLKKEMEAASTAFDDMLASAAPVPEVLEDTGAAADDLGEAFEDLSGIIEGAFEESADAADSFSDSLSGTFDVLADGESEVGALEGAFNSFTSRVTTGLDLVIESANQTADSIRAAGEAAEGAGDQTVDAADRMADAFGGLGDLLGDVFGPEAQSALAEFAAQFEDVWRGAQESGESAAGGVSLAWNEGGKEIVGAAAAAMAGLVAAFDEGSQQAVLALQTISAFATGDWVSGVIGAIVLIVDAFGSADTVSRGEELEMLFAELSADANRTAADMQAFIAEFLKMLELVLTLTAKGKADLLSLQRLGEIFEGILALAVEMGVEGVAAIEELTSAIIEMGVFGEEVADQIAAATDQAFQVLADRTQFVLDQTAALVAGIEQMFAAGTVGPRQLQFAAESVLGAFNAMVASGVPLSQIMETLGTSIGLIGDQAAATGASLPPAFAELTEVFEVLSAGPVQNLLSGLEGIGAAATAAGNLGLLTASQFDTFGDSIDKAFKKLQQQGLEGPEAIAALAPQLQELLNLQQQYGFNVDANTQALLDQALAQGVIQDQQLTTEDILITGFDRMLEALNALIVALGGVPVVFETWGVSAATAADETAEATGRMAAGSTAAAEQMETAVVESVTAAADEIALGFETTTLTVTDHMAIMTELVGSATTTAAGQFETFEVEALGAMIRIAAGADGVASDIANSFDGIPITFDIEQIQVGGGGGPGQGGPIEAQHGTGGFLDFGSGSPAILHGSEQVITAAEGVGIAQMVARAIAVASRGGDEGPLLELAKANVILATEARRHRKTLIAHTNSLTKAVQAKTAKPFTSETPGTVC